MVIIFEGTQNIDKWYPVRLVDSLNLNTPILAIAFGSVTCNYGFEGAAADIPSAVVVGDWREQGGGNYWLQFGLGEFANVGKYTVRVSATACADCTFYVEVKNASYIANAVWDEVLTSATHDVTNSAGRKLRNLFITTGTAQAGGGNSIQLALAESATNHIFNQNIVYITKGLGAGQTRVIMNYDGGTKQALVNRTWDTNPNNTSEYVIIASSDILASTQGLAQAGSPTTIRLAITASAVNDYYTGLTVYINSGTGAGQARIITGYTGINTNATIYPAWATQPDGTSVYKVMRVGPAMVDAVEPVLQALLLGLMGSTVLDTDLQLHLGAGVGFRNIGNILGQLAQSEFELRTNIFATIAVPAQGITASMARRKVMQYQQVDMSYTKNWAAPDRTYYILYHYNAQRLLDIAKASLGTIW